MVRKRDSEYNFWIIQRVSLCYALFPGRMAILYLWLSQYLFIGKLAESETKWIHVKGKFQQEEGMRESKVVLHMWLLAMIYRRSS
jgi:hypothetical protein